MINDVYNLVQHILNKNGRGILSPARFVLFAESSQLKIYRNAIADYRKAKYNTQTYSSPENLRMLEDVIDRFSKTSTLTRQVGASVMAYHVLPTDYMEWGEATIDNKPIVKIPSTAKSFVKRSYFIEPSLSNPFCYIEGKSLYVLPIDIGVIDDSGTDIAVDEVELSYFRYPLKPNWTYSTVNGKAVFYEGSPNYQDFELPYSMYNKLVTDILLQAGMHIRDEEVTKYAADEDAKEYQKDNSK